MLAAAAIAWLSGPAAAEAAGITLPPGPGANLVYARCQTCHDLQYIVDAKGLLPAQWKSTLAGMKDYGLTISPADEATILAYLTTYLGPNPPPAAASSPASGATRMAGAATSGRHVFEENCSGCHGPEGAGQAGIYPALAGNADLAKDAGLPARVVLFGLTGPIEAGGASYTGTMPPFGHLGDADIAAVVNYVRSAWGNAAGAGSVDAKAIAALRAHPLTSSDVHKYRAALLSPPPR
ncbi:MAG: cytochrome c [Proteobacteria bacterium]|nr:cytochrome c [Pseudomonadota bacterium]